MPAETAVSWRERVEALTAESFTVPTDAPESDGTFQWERTTIVVVHVQSAGAIGLGIPTRIGLRRTSLRKRRLQVVLDRPSARGSRPGLGLELKRADAEPFAN